MLSGSRALLVEKWGYDVIRVPAITFHSPTLEFINLFEVMYRSALYIKPDLIIGDMFSYASAIADSLKCPFILIADYLFPEDINVLFRFFARRTDLVIVCDTKLHWKLPNLLKPIEDKIVCTGPILRPFDELINTKKDILKRKLGFDPKDFLVLVTLGGSGGYLMRYKLIHEIAMEAFEMVRNDIPNVTMLICTGSSPRSIVTSKKRASKVIVKGFVDDLAPYIRASDVIITKGGHGTLMEASVLGTPIIAINLYEITRRKEELYNIRRFKKLGNLIHIPPTELNSRILANAIIKLLKDHKLREKMIKAGQKIPKDGRIKAASIIIELLRKNKNKKIK